MSKRSLSTESAFSLSTESAFAWIFRVYYTNRYNQSIHPIACNSIPQAHLQKQTRRRRSCGCSQFGCSQSLKPISKKQVSEHLYSTRGFGSSLIEAFKALRKIFNTIAARSSASRLASTLFAHTFLFQRHQYPSVRRKQYPTNTSAHPASDTKQISLQSSIQYIGQYPLIAATIGRSSFPVLYSANNYGSSILLASIHGRSIFIP